MVLDAITFILAMLLLFLTGSIAPTGPGGPWTGWRLINGVLWLVTLLALIFHMLGKFS